MLEIHKLRDVQLPVKVYRSYSVYHTPIEAFYDFITNTEEGRYLFEHAYLAECRNTEEPGITHLIMSWRFNNKPAETFYHLKWS